MAKNRILKADGDAAIRRLGWTPRPGQAEATTELIKALFSGTPVIGFTAPTGTGKSGMTLAAIRWTEARAVFATPTKQLQQQYADTFRLPVLYGRAEYGCPLSPTGNAALAPCIAGQPCLFKSAGQCAYFNARSAIQGKSIVVVNHSLLVSAKLMRDDLLSYPVVVVDECHRFGKSVIESLTPSADELAILDSNNWDISKIKELLKTAFITNDTYRAAVLIKVLRIATCRKLAPGLFTNGEIDINQLIRSGILGSRVILVSATMPDIPTDVLIEGPPQVPAHLRPLIVIPVAAVNSENQYGVAGIMTETILRIIDEINPQSPVIIHTGTTVLSETIADILANSPLADRIVPAWGSLRKSVTTVRRRPSRQILIGPALMDGVDIPSNLQIIVKVPFPTKGQGGVQEAARQIVQAYGRLVRGPGTSGTTFVLDANFRLVESFLPQYVREAVRWEKNLTQEV